MIVEIDNKIVGLLDLEYELEKGTVGYKTNELTVVIWHLEVLPEYRNRSSFIERSSQITSKY